MNEQKEKYGKNKWLRNTKYLKVLHKILSKILKERLEEK